MHTMHQNGDPLVTGVPPSVDAPGPRGAQAPGAEIARQIDALADLPVQVDVAADWSGELVSWIEGDLRWQVVRGDGALRPQARITDDPDDHTATVVVTTDAGRAGTVDRGGRSGAPVVVWPSGRAGIVSVVARAGGAAAAASEGVGCRLLSVAGLRGGAGASTLALALGGVAAWNGARTLVAGADDLVLLCGSGPWTGPGLAEVVRLAPPDAGREAAALARPVDGIDGLRVLGGARPTPVSVESWPFDVVVLDLRRRWEAAGVVVAVAGQRQEPAPVPDGRLLVRDTEGFARAEAAALLGRTPDGWLADDPRVRRAGAAGRLPSGLPGRWLRGLAGAMAARGAKAAA